MGRISPTSEYLHYRIRKTNRSITKVLSGVVNEKAGISSVLSLRLSKALNKSPQFWLTVQMNYYLFQVEKKIRKAIKTVRSGKSKSGSLSVEKVVNGYLNYVICIRSAAFEFWLHASEGYPSQGVRGPILFFEVSGFSEV
jgi:hypothetical protein